jgi:hypothetical protein
MIHQRSFRNLQPKSRSKSKTPLPSTNLKAEPALKRAIKGETGHLHPSAQHAKVAKSDSKAKIGKGAQQAAKPKLDGSQRQSPDYHAMHMKSNLKQLISKNTSSKPKAAEFVPDLIKNIEKHCKELTKIHEKEQKVYGKRPSLQ